METRQTLKEMPNLRAISAGRTLMGTLPENHDLVDTISALCRQHDIALAAFSVHGNVVQATIGVFDPLQQVYITAVESFTGEIVHCAGWITGSPAVPEVSARIAIADDAGNVIGGKLFTETLVLGAEIFLQEWLGPSIHRRTDPDTGLAVVCRCANGTADIPSLF